MEAKHYAPHYTTEDYERWEGDWELWFGRAVAMSPSPNFRHQEMLPILSALMLAELKNHAACRCRLVVEHDWRIADDLIVRPDISVVCRPVDTEFLTIAPDLVVEIFSPSTHLKDRNHKRSLYADHGVGVYLMVDPEAGTLSALALEDGQYAEVNPNAGGDFVLPLRDGCEIKLPAKLDAGI